VCTFYDEAGAQLVGGKVLSDSCGPSAGELRAGPRCSLFLCSLSQTKKKFRSDFSIGPPCVCPCVHQWHTITFKYKHVYLSCRVCVTVPSSLCDSKLHEAVQHLLCRSFDTGRPIWPFLFDLVHRHIVSLISDL